MKEINIIRDNIMKSNRFSIRITTRSSSKNVKKTRRILWAQDLVEVLGENKHNPSVSPTNSEFSNLINLGKDGTVVPRQVELKRLCTLVKDSYLHWDDGYF